jgi:hypothetical protein
MNIFESTTEERELMDSKLVAFNKANVPFLQSEEWTSLSHVLRNNLGQL